MTSLSYIAGLRHASHYSHVLEERGRHFAQSGEGALESWESIWGQIDAAVGWAILETDRHDRQAAHACVNLLTGPGMMLLDRLRPPQERVIWLAAAERAARLAKLDGALVNIINNIGIAQLALGDARAALKSHRRGLKAALASPDRERASLVAHVLMDIGVCHRHLGNRHLALSYHRRALEELKGTRGHDGLRLNCFGNIAVAEAELGNLDAAITGFKSVIRLARKSRARWQEGYAKGNLGRTYAERGDFRRAERLHAMDLAIARDLHNDRGVVNALGELGNAKLGLKKVKAALRCHEEQMTLAGGLGRQRELAEAHVNIACSLARDDKVKAARTHARTAWVMLGDLENYPRQVEAAIRMADAFAEADAVDEAVDYLRLAVGTTRERKIAGMIKLKRRLKVLSATTLTAPTATVEQSGDDPSLPNKAERS